jgi:hypothetical protein
MGDCGGGAEEDHRTACWDDGEHMEKQRREVRERLGFEVHCCLVRRKQGCGRNGLGDFHTGERSVCCAEAGVEAGGEGCVWEEPAVVVSVVLHGKGKVANAYTTASTTSMGRRIGSPITTGRLAVASPRISRRSTIHGSGCCRTSRQRSRSHMRVLRSIIV